MAETLLDLIEPRGFFEDRKTAFLFWDGTKPFWITKKLPYWLLWTQSRTFASALAEIGVKKGERVGIYLPNVIQFPISYFGVLRVGGIAVPMSTLCTEEQLAGVIRDAGMDTIVVFDSLYPKLAKVAKEAGVKKVIFTSLYETLPWLKAAIKMRRDKKRGSYIEVPTNRDFSVFSFEKMLRYGNRRVPNAEVCADDLALLLYTSGTTGEPKGVMHTHSSLLANAHACRKLILELGMQEGEEVFLAAAPYFHIMGIAAMLNTALLMRAKVVLIPKPSDFKTTLEAIWWTRASGFVGMPALFGGLSVELAKTKTKADISSLKLCLSGASRMDLETKSNFESFWGGKILEGYGLTETGVVSCQRNGKIDGASTPLEGVACKLMDVDENGVGELLVKSAGTFSGYWQKPEKTGEVLDKDGWFHTGDLAKAHGAGGLVVLGRASEDFVKGTRGEKVPLDPIEKILMTHPQVVDAAVVGEVDPNAKRGYIIKAFVVPRDQKTVCGEIIKSQLAELLKELSLAQRPDEVKCIGAVPRNAMGKVLKKQLKASG